VAAGPCSCLPTKGRSGSSAKWHEASEAGDHFSVSSGGFDEGQNLGAQVAPRRRGVWPLANTYAKKLGEGRVIFDHVGWGCPRRRCLAFPFSRGDPYG
jgi:hypothetical protein